MEKINECINHSKPWRESNHIKQLLLSSISPHNVVTSCAMSGWLKKTLKQTVINTDLFKPHPARSVSSSDASVGGAPLVEVLQSGSWSHQSSWKRFNNKDNVQKGELFPDKIYKNTNKN